MPYAVVTLVHVHLVEVVGAHAEIAVELLVVQIEILEIGIRAGRIFDEDYGYAFPDR